MSRALASGVRGSPAVRHPWWRRPALLVALLLFTADALLLGQGLLAALLLVTVGGWLLPKALLLFKVGRDVRPTIRVALLFSLTAVAIMVTINVNNHLARQRATRLIEALDLYRAANGRYPLVLDALVPRYVASVPHAKFTLVFNQFVYQRFEQRALLGYVEVPPFGRPCFDFEQRRWLNVTLAGQGQFNCGRLLAVAQQESTP